MTTNNTSKLKLLSNHAWSQIHYSVNLDMSGAKACTCLFADADSTQSRQPVACTRPLVLPASHPIHTPRALLQGCIRTPHPARYATHTHTTSILPREGPYTHTSPCMIHNTHTVRIRTGRERLRSSWYKYQRYITQRQFIDCYRHPYSRPPPCT